MGNEVLLGSVLAVSMFCAFVGLVMALCAHFRIAELKSENELNDKDFAYQLKERFTEIEYKIRQLEKDK